MQAIAETLFDIGYLISVITIGGMMIGKSNGKKEYRLFGIMAVILGVGDSFHLVPRIYALCTTGLENYTALLGAGKFVTSITMTIFYVLFYQVWRIRYRISGKRELTILVYFLSALRILLCLMPQNQWTSPSAPLSWGIYRNIPFETRDTDFRCMWLTILLSFGFYIPVVLWADSVPLVGMLMIPKTCAYLWAVILGYQSMKKTLGK